LGAGIAVTSFARQNIDVAVIEIDPAVYDASRQYFGLPDLDSDRIFLEDARVVVAEKRRSALENGISSADKYDYVVHDCFSGGGVPAHLFTLEFWEDLKTIMNPEGVVAVVSLRLHGRFALINHCISECPGEDRFGSH
jgi:spermidine synthase